MVNTSKREAKYYSLSTGIFIRLGKTDSISKQYKDGYLEFGCPANWIDYANKHCDGIADKYEAIVGHVKKDDPRLSMLGDDGIPLNMFRSLWIEDDSNDMVFVRYLYLCLTPALCFFSIPVKEIALNCKKEDNKSKGFRINLSVFYKAMDININECSVLIITFPERLFQELNEEIPNNLQRCQNIDINRYNPNCPFLTSMINYNLDLEKEFFDIQNFDAIFRKRPQYSNQNEARIIIPNVNFVSDPVYNINSYKDNTMKMYLPNLASYSYIFPAKDIHTIDFFNFNERYDRYELGFR